MSKLQSKCRLEIPNTTPIVPFLWTLDAPTCAPSNLIPENTVPKVSLTCKKFDKKRSITSRYLWVKKETYEAEVSRGRWRGGRENPNQAGSYELRRLGRRDGRREGKDSR
jgi:hypothetical protein